MIPPQINVVVYIPMTNDFILCKGKGCELFQNIELHKCTSCLLVFEYTWLMFVICVATEQYETTFWKHADMWFIITHVIHILYTQSKYYMFIHSRNLDVWNYLNIMEISPNGRYRGYESLSRKLWTT